MSDTDALFEDQLLGYFADDDWAARGAQPVSSIFDQIRKGGRANFRFEQIAAPGTVSELRRVLDEMVSDGLLTCRGHDSDPAYEITDHGIYTASFENPEFASDTKSSRWTDGSDLLNISMIVRSAILRQSGQRPSVLRRPFVLIRRLGRALDWFWQTKLHLSGFAVWQVIFETAFMQHGSRVTLTAKT